MPEPALKESPAPALPSRTVRGTAICGLGVAVPERVVTNREVADRLGVSPEWITERTGVERRHVAASDRTLVDLATDAGRSALSDAGVEAGEIDLVIVATVTGEMLCPAAAPVVAANLGCDRVAAFDVNAACSGFLAALDLAASRIATRASERALVIGADLMYRVIDHDDKATAGIFADGGGAVVLAPCPGEQRIGRIHLGSDGAHGNLVEATRAEAIIRMNGHDTFRHAVGRLAEVTVEALEESGQTIDDVDLFVYHQANSRILAAVGDRLGLPAEKVVDCVGEYGNTSAGSIPIALDAARSEGRLRTGARVLLGAFGGGLTWGSGLITWGEPEGAEDVTA